MIIKIPLTFAEDHDVYRDLTSGTRIASNKRYVTYEVTREDLLEWLGDAEYYADLDFWRMATSGNHEDLLPVIRSAGRSIPIIKAALAEASA
jgi:hypothetical protein